MQQKPFPFSDQEDTPTYDEFIISPCNEQAYKWLQQTNAWPHPISIIYGPKSSGKTHLAHNWSQQTGATIINTENILAHTESNNPLCIDIEQWNTSIEEPIFHVYNHYHQLQTPLLIITNDHPSQLNIRLNDLKSRLQSSPSIPIHMPDEALLKKLLLKQLSDRQLRVNEQVIDYLLLRMERSFKSLHQWVDTLDQSSLQKRRNISIPLIKELLESKTD